MDQGRNLLSKVFKSLDKDPIVQLVSFCPTFFVNLCPAMQMEDLHGSYPISIQGEVDHAQTTQGFPLKVDS